MFTGLLRSQRITNLKTIPGTGVITALTWVLEMDDVYRFRSAKEAISYCGICGEERSSAEKVVRTPISKQRKKHIQSVLIWRICLQCIASGDLSNRQKTLVAR